MPDRANHLTDTLSMKNPTPTPAQDMDVSDVPVYSRVTVRLREESNGEVISRTTTTTPKSRKITCTTQIPRTANDAETSSPLDDFLYSIGVGCQQDREVMAIVLENAAFWLMAIVSQLELKKEIYLETWQQKDIYAILVTYGSVGRVIVEISSPPGTGKSHVYSIAALFAPAFEKHMRQILPDGNIPDHPLYLNSLCIDTVKGILAIHNLPRYEKFKADAKEIISKGSFFSPKCKVIFLMPAQLFSQHDEFWKEILTCFNVKLSVEEPQKVFSGLPPAIGAQRIFKALLSSRHPDINADMLGKRNSTKVKILQNLVVSERQFLVFKQYFSEDVSNKIWYTKNKCDFNRHEDPHVQTHRNFVYMLTRTRPHERISYLEKIFPYLSREGFNALRTINQDLYDDCLPFFEEIRKILEKVMPKQLSQEQIRASQECVSNYKKKILDKLEFARKTMNDDVLTEIINHFSHAITVVSDEADNAGINGLLKTKTFSYVAVFGRHTIMSSATLLKKRNDIPSAYPFRNADDIRLVNEQADTLAFFTNHLIPYPALAEARLTAPVTSNETEVPPSVQQSFDIYQKDNFFSKMEEPVKAYIAEVLHGFSLTQKQFSALLAIPKACLDWGGVYWINGIQYDNLIKEMTRSYDLSPEQEMRLITCKDKFRESQNKIVALLNEEIKVSDPFDADILTDLKDKLKMKWDHHAATNKLELLDEISPAHKMTLYEKLSPFYSEMESEAVKSDDISKGNFSVFSNSNTTKLIVNNSACYTMSLSPLLKIKVDPPFKKIFILKFLEQGVPHKNIPGLGYDIAMQVIKHMLRTVRLINSPFGKNEACHDLGSWKSLPGEVMASNEVPRGLNAASNGRSLEYLLHFQLPGDKPPQEIFQELGRFFRHDGPVQTPPRRQVTYLRTFDLSALKQPQYMLAIHQLKNLILQYNQKVPFASHVKSVNIRKFIMTKQHSEYLLLIEQFIKKKDIATYCIVNGLRGNPHFFNTYLEYLKEEELYAKFKELQEIYESLTACLEKPIAIDYARFVPDWLGSIEYLEMALAQLNKKMKEIHESVHNRLCKSMQDFAGKKKTESITYKGVKYPIPYNTSHLVHLKLKEYLKSLYVGDTLPIFNTVKDIMQFLPEDFKLPTKDSADSAFEKAKACVDEMLSTLPSAGEEMDWEEGEELPEGLLFTDEDAREMVAYLDGPGSSSHAPHSIPASTSKACEDPSSSRNYHYMPEDVSDKRKLIDTGAAFYEDRTGDCHEVEEHVLVADFITMVYEEDAVEFWNFNLTNSMDSDFPPFQRNVCLRLYNFTLTPSQYEELSALSFVVFPTPPIISSPQATAPFL